MENLAKEKMEGKKWNATDLSGILENIYGLNINYGEIIDLCHTIENKIYGDHKVNDLVHSDEEPAPNSLIEKLNLQITELNIKGENIYRTLENINKFLGE